MLARCAIDQFLGMAGQVLISPAWAAAWQQTQVFFYFSVFCIHCLWATHVLYAFFLPTRRQPCRYFYLSTSSLTLTTMRPPAASHAFPTPPSPLVSQDYCGHALIPVIVDRDKWTS